MPLIGILIIVLIGWWIVGNQPVAAPTAPEQATTLQPSGTPAKKTTTKKPAATDVVGVAEGLSDATVFASWMQSTGVIAELAGSGPYTLFVPTDAAIAQLPAGTFKNLSAAEQKRFVEYHVVVGKVINADTQFAGTITALSNDQLNFIARPGQTTLVGGGAIIARYTADNGIVYVVNSSLIPPKKSQ